MSSKLVAIHSASGLLPKASVNSFEINSAGTSLYNISNHSHSEAMYQAQRSIVEFLNECYSFVQDNYPEIFKRDRSFILSNRGTNAFIRLVGSLNVYETNRHNVTVLTKPVERFDCIQKYLKVLLDQINKLPKETEEFLLVKLGAGADVYWFRYFQFLIHQKIPEFLPDGLSDWIERQDSELQDKGRKLGTEIEKFIKANVIKKLKLLFGDNWELEIGSIQRECDKRAKEEMEKRYKEGLPRKDIPWTDMFFINDYKTIIEKYWVKKPSIETPGFVTFESVFSIDIGAGFNSKTEKIKWLSLFNSHRNSWAHEGTKEKGLNKEDVEFLEKIHDLLLSEQIH